VEDGTRARWDLAPLFDHIVNCVFITSQCHVITWFTLQGLKLARVTVKPLDMGATCSLQSFSSNSTF
jgi:hypothetical protein